MANPVTHGHSADNVPDEWVFNCQGSARVIYPLTYMKKIRVLWGCFSKKKVKIFLGVISTLFEFFFDAFFSSIGAFPN